MTFYEEFLGSIFFNLGTESTDRLTTCLLTDKPPKRGEEEFLRGVYFACKQVKATDADREREERQKEYLKEHAIFLNKHRKVYCPNCGKEIEVCVDDSCVGVAKCDCGEEFKYPIGKTKNKSE